MPDPAKRGRRHPIWVLLGPDYSGKSTIMKALRHRGDLRLASTDAEFLRPPYTILPELRRLFLDLVLPNASRLLSPDFVLSGLQMPLVYLRDQALAEASEGPVLVDSYLYKALAKCLLLGMANDRTLAFWRSFPPPDGVLFVQVHPGEALRRARAAGGPNGFEHYSHAGSEAGFLEFQRDLTALMLREVAGVPTTMLDGHARPADIARDLLEQIQRRDPRPRPGRRIDERSQPTLAQPGPAGEGAFSRRTGAGW